MALALSKHFRVSREITSGLRSSLVVAFVMACPSVMAAQPGISPKRLGILSTTVCPTSEKPTFWGPLLQNLAGRGWRQGENLIIDCVAAGGVVKRVPELALELVARRPDVLLGASNPTVLALKHATTTIPIVTAASDPLRGHIIESLAHPEANITGMAPMIWDLVGKRMELLKDILPRLSRVAVIRSHTTDDAESTGGLQALETDVGAAAKELDFSWKLFDPSNLEEMDRTFAQIAADGFDAAYVWSSPFTFLNRRPIAQMALRYGVPTISDNSDFASEGILLTYGMDLSRLVEGTAEYIDPLLRGAKPADLPLRQPTEFDLVINLKTAKALGIKVPASVLILATEVVE